MLREQLSTDLTSNAGEERLAVVVDMVIGADPSVESSEIYRARVRNHAKLACNSVAPWLKARALRHKRERPSPDWRRICACRTESPRS